MDNCKITSIILLILFSGCSHIAPKIEVLNYGLTKSKEQLVIYSDSKRAEFGIAFFYKIILGIGTGGTRIDSVSLFTNDTLVWKIAAKENVNATVGPIIYGENSKYYDQIYPALIEDVKPLVLNNEYNIKLYFNERVIEKKFIYYRSTIYFSLDDIKKNT